MKTRETKTPLPLAIQLYGVRSLMQERFQETLRALAGIGFRNIEWSGTHGGMAPEQLAEFLGQLGLRVMGMHAALPQLLDANSPVYDYARCLRPEFLTVSSNVTPDNWIELLKQIREARRAAAGRGFVLTYHNHAHDFRKLPDGRTILDAIFEATTPDNLQFLFDVFFACYAGFDPNAYLERFAGRAPQIHFNDMAPAALNAPQPAPDYAGHSTELGTGCMDLAAIYRAAVRTGVRWVVLEQHSLRDNPLESARHNFEYYRKMTAEGEN